MVTAETTAVFSISVAAEKLLSDANKTLSDLPFAPKNGKKYTQGEVATWLKSTTKSVSDIKSAPELKSNTELKSDIESDPDTKYIYWEDRAEANKLTATGDWEIIAAKTVVGGEYGRHKLLILRRCK